MDTLSYYSKNSRSFYEATINADMSQIYESFLPLIPLGGTILDFGCGSGRDSKYFLSKGFDVVAVDGSEEMCNLASKLLVKEVKKMFFSDLDSIATYDGIWACASILHLERSCLKDVFRKMERALKKGGYIYSSFKYGDKEEYINERYYTYFNENKFKEFIKGVDNLVVQKLWSTYDSRKEYSETKWLNVILRKEVL